MLGGGASGRVVGGAGGPGGCGRLGTCAIAALRCRASAATRLNRATYWSASTHPLMLSSNWPSGETMAVVGRAVTPYRSAVAGSWSALIFTGT